MLKNSTALLLRSIFIECKRRGEVARMRGGRGHDGVCETILCDYRTRQEATGVQGGGYLCRWCSKDATSLKAEEVTCDDNLHKDLFLIISFYYYVNSKLIILI